MPAPDHVKRGKLYFAAIMIVTGGIIIGSPYVLSWKALISPLKPNAWVILAILYFGIVFKGAIGYLIARHFRNDKFAYDLCALVMGGVLTCLSLQVTSDKDIFPGIETISFLRFMSTFGVTPAGQHATLLGAFFWVSLVATIVAAIGVSETEDGKPQGLWTLGASGLAFVLLGVYGLIVITKG